ncbi:MAG TPA: hypothetical protein VFB27_00655 [Opitutaceae bacterium]|nr:hypothetical protein [Opitutaceae bacterium]
MKRKLKPLSLVKWVPHQTVNDKKLRRNRAYLFLGEISNMKEHCVIADANTGKIYIGYHTDAFIELTDSEI